jgi:hypothetical protein
MKHDCKGPYSFTYTPNYLLRRVGYIPSPSYLFTLSPSHLVQVTNLFVSYCHYHFWLTVSICHSFTLRLYVFKPTCTFLVGCQNRSVLTRTIRSERYRLQLRVSLDHLLPSVVIITLPLRTHTHFVLLRAKPAPSLHNKARRRWVCKTKVNLALHCFATPCRSGSGAILEDYVAYTHWCWAPQFVYFLTSFNDNSGIVLSWNDCCPTCRHRTTFELLKFASLAAYWKIYVASTDYSG